MSKQVKIHYKPDMVCPYCGNEEFYIKQSYHGTCEYNHRFDGKEDAENGDMWQAAEMKDLRKYAYCNKCDKRLFELEEFYNYETD